MNELQKMICMSMLTALYAKIPESKCKGLCQYSCGQMSFTESEYQNIPKELRHPKPDYFQSACSMARRENQHQLGQPITEPDCSYLVEGKCSIYEYRPFICRVWGSNSGPMNRCRFGCEETVSDALYMELLQMWAQISMLDGSKEAICNAGKEIREIKNAARPSDDR